LENPDYAAPLSTDKKVDFSAVFHNNPAEIELQNREIIKIHKTCNLTFKKNIP